MKWAGWTSQGCRLGSDSFSRAVQETLCTDLLLHLWCCSSLVIITSKLWQQQLPGVISVVTASTRTWTMGISGPLSCQSPPIHSNPASDFRALFATVSRQALLCFLPWHLRQKSVSFLFLPVSILLKTPCDLCFYTILHSWVLVHVWASQELTRMMKLHCLALWQKRL